MVMSHLKTSVFHSVMILYHGKDYQIGKVFEEIKELSDALREKNRDHIVEELADVEIVLPYLKKIYVYNAQLKIEPYPEFAYEYDDIAEVVLILMRFRAKYGDNKKINNLLQDSLSLFCYALGDIYYKYDILPDEIEKWKEEKYRRCLKNIAKKIIG